MITRSKHERKVLLYDEDDESRLLLSTIMLYIQLNFTAKYHSRDLYIVNMKIAVLISDYNHLEQAKNIIRCAFLIWLHIWYFPNVILLSFLLYIHN